MKTLARELVNRKQGTIPAEELQYLRGFLAGMKFLLEQPDKATRALSREEMNASG